MVYVRSHKRRTEGGNTVVVKHMRGTPRFKVGDSVGTGGGYGGKVTSVYKARDGKNKYNVKYPDGREYIYREKDMFFYEA